MNITSARPDGQAANPLRAGLDSNRIQDPCTIVFFGASGDLTKRMLIPAMYNLRLTGILPTNFGIIGFSRSDKSHYDFREEMKASLEEFSRSGAPKDPLWSDFAERMYYIQGSFDDPAAYADLKRRLEENDTQHGTAGNILYYLSTPPTVFPVIIQQLAAAGLGPRDQAKGWSRIIIEKPFGTDLDSARALQAEVEKVFDEKASLSHRSLPRQRAGPGHHGAAISQTSCSSRFGIAGTSIACRSRRPKPSASKAAAATTITRALCAT